MLHLYKSKNLHCKYCDLAEKLIKRYHVSLKVIQMNDVEWEHLRKKTGKKGVPYIFTGTGHFIGGYEDLENWIELKFDVKYYSKRDLENIAKTLHKVYSIDYRVFLHSFLKCLKTKFLRDTSSYTQTQIRRPSSCMTNSCYNNQQSSIVPSMICDRNSCYSL